MAQTLRKLGQVQLAATDTAIYTPSAGTYAAVTGIFFCNTDTVERTFQLYHVNAAGSISTSNALYYDYPIATKRTFSPPTPIVLEPGQMLRGLASSASKITVTVFGIERT